MPASRNPWLLYFAAINALVTALVALSTVPDELLSAFTSGTLFILIALPGHFFFFAIIIYLPLTIAEKLISNKRNIVIPAAILYSLLVFVVFIDAKIFDLYRFHINGMVLNLLAGGEAAQILSIPASTWIIVLEGFAGLLVGEWVLAEILYDRFDGSKHRPFVIWFTAAAIMLGGQGFYAYSDARGDKTVTAMLRYIPWAQPLTVKRSLKKFGFAVAAVDESGLREHRYSSLDYPKRPLVCNRHAAKPMNIVFLVLDSMRYDMLTAETMPKTSSLLDRAQFFENHYSGGNATRFGLFSLLYGLPGTYWYSMLSEQRGSALFDVLMAQGYQMLIYGSASWSSPEFDRTAFAAISDRIVSGQSLRDTNPNDNRHPDTLVTNRFIERLENRDRDRPFFGLVFFDAPHNFSKDGSAPAPFQPALRSVNYLALDNEYDPTEFINLYRNSIYYNDMLIGQVLDALQRQHLLDETIVIVTSDHGKEFNETRQNYWGHNGNFSKYQTKIPLLIYWPGEPARKFSQRTTSEDIVPTLMQGLLGCENPIADYSTGQNLFSDTYRSRPLLIESWSRRALVTHDRIIVFEGNGLTFVYDHDYKEMTAEVADPNLIREAMIRMAKFLR